MVGKTAGFTRRKFCKTSAGLPMLAGLEIGSFDPFRPDPAVRWRLPATGSRSPIPTASDEGRVYVTTETGMSALGVDDGSEQWGHEGPIIGVPQQGVGEETVYAVRPDGNGFIALDKDSGEERWTTDLTGLPVATESAVYVAGDEFRALVPDDGTTNWKFEIPDGAAGLALTLDTVFVGGVGRLHAIRRADGTERWRFENLDASRWRRLHPLHADADMSRVVVWDDRARHLRFFEAGGGRELGRFDVDTKADLFRGVLSENAAFVVDGNDVVAVTLSEGRELWRFAAREQLSPDLRLVEDGIIAHGAHRVYCLSADEGATMWTLKRGREIYDAEVDGDLTLAIEDQKSGRKRLVRVDGRGGSLRWVVDAGTGHLNTLTADGQVFVSTEDGLTALSTPSGVAGAVERGIARYPGLILAGVVSLGGITAAGLRYFHSTK